jgi:hypothetical protein
MNNRTAIRTTILLTGGSPRGKSLIIVRKGKMVSYLQYANATLGRIIGQGLPNSCPRDGKSMSIRILIGIIFHLVAGHGIA